MEKSGLLMLGFQAITLIPGEWSGFQAITQKQGKIAK